MAFGDLKNLPKKRASDKVLRDKVFDIAKNFFNEKSSGGAITLARSGTLDTWATRDKFAFEKKML